jgi:DNA polymerase
MDTLNVDIETFSSNGIDGGVYKYVEAEDFTILMIAYSFNYGPTKIIDLTKQSMPRELIDWLLDKKVLKIAYSAAFEIECLYKYLGIEKWYENWYTQWECTMVRGAMIGLPMGLDAATKAINSTHKKDPKGKQLIRYFCIPCKPTLQNGFRTRNFPEHAPDKWQEFLTYCVRDVDAEKSISILARKIPITPTERQLWYLDQEINRRGVVIDVDLAENAIDFDIRFHAELVSELKQLTFVTNPNSAAQLKKWLSPLMPFSNTDALTKENIPALLQDVDDMEYEDGHKIKRVLKLRQDISKTSVKKYAKMIDSMCSDGKVKGMFQYYGAGRTGRWAGRGVQLHNLPRGVLEKQDLNFARELIRSGEYKVFKWYYNAPSALSSLIRAAFIPRKGYVLGVADYSAIEARIIAWIAGEKWRLEVFKTHGLIYEASAAKMFNIPIESIDKKSEYRTKGKISELALGFGGGPDALMRMAKSTGAKLDEKGLPKLVKIWRNTNQKIVNLWRHTNECVIKAVETGQRITIGFNTDCFVEHGILFIKLPSGRRLSYYAPEIREGKYGPSLTYMGLNQETNQWVRIFTYGGKLIENIVQAIARDILAHGMLMLKKAGYDIVLHVHDEIAAEYQPGGEKSAADMCRIMSIPPDWARTLPLGAEGFETNYYKK